MITHATISTWESKKDHATEMPVTTEVVIRYWRPDSVYSSIFDKARATSTDGTTKSHSLQITHAGNIEIVTQDDASHLHQSIDCRQSELLLQTHVING